MRFEYDLARVMVYSLYCVNFWLLLWCQPGPHGIVRSEYTGGFGSTVMLGLPAGLSENKDVTKHIIWGLPAAQLSFNSQGIGQTGVSS